MIDTPAGIALLALVAIVLFNARNGTLGLWFEAKFLGRGEGATPPRKERFATVKGLTNAGAGAGGGNPGGANPGQGGMVLVNGAWVSPRMAGPWRQLVEGARDAGFNLTGGGWRSSTRQRELREQNCPDPVNSPASECSPPTAKVGTSKHEIGDAVDVTVNGRTLRSTDALYRWLSVHAPPLGITAAVPGEPWHWQLG